MPDSGGRKRSPIWAIVAVLGTAAVLVLGLWLWSLKLSYNQARQYRLQQEAEQPGEVCVRLPYLAPLCVLQPVHSAVDDLRSDDDLRAQQEMADWAFVVALVSAAGFVVSLSGVALVYATFRKTGEAVDAANRTADDAQRIGEAQVRAYLHCRSAKYRRTKDDVVAVVEIVNTGQSPASNVYIRGTAYFQVVGGLPRYPRVLGWVESRNETEPCQPVAAGGSVIEEFRVSWETDFPEDEEYSREAQRAAFVDASLLSFYLTIEWTDVFGRTHEAPLTLDATVGSIPSAPRRKRSYAGKLTIRLEDARAVDREQ